MNLKCLVFLLLAWVPIYASSQETDSSFVEDPAWTFRIGPYYWFLGIEASLVRPPQPSTLPEPRYEFNLSIPYEEVQNSLKFAFLINTEYNKNRWIGILNATSFILEGEAITPREIVLQNSHYRLAMGFGEALGGYEVFSRKKFQIQGLVGAKLFFNKIEARATAANQIDFSGERQNTWVEPILGVKLRYIPVHRVEVNLYGDYGPIRKKEELTSQLVFNINILLNKWLYVAPGYRYWLFQVDKSEAIFNGEIYGAYIRVGAQF